MNKEKAYIEKMFDSIAGHYDFLNHFLSAGIDRRWRRRLADAVRGAAPSRILDVATGTADLALLLARELPQARVEGVDISAEMLRIGRRKAAGAGLEGRVRLSRQDAAALDFGDGRFDAVVSSFGVRNFEDTEGGLTEMGRVLRPGGTLCVLEFSMPEGRVLGGLYRFYFSRILPRLGRSVSGNPGAYAYLYRSASEFPYGRAFLDILLRCGFSEVRARPLSGGIATLYTARKSEIPKP